MLLGWTKRIIEWRNKEDAVRGRGRRPSRWSDNLKWICSNWMQAAQDWDLWMILRGAYYYDDDGDDDDDGDTLFSL